MRSAIILFCLVFSIQLFAQHPDAQWRGPERTGIYNETGLLKSWPEGGPQLLWHYDGLGVGHSSAAVTNDYVITAGTLSNTGFIIAFDHNGKELWRTEFGPEWMENWDGVRSTPVIVGDKIYMVSSYGLLFCLNIADGSYVWKKDLIADFYARNIRWGITENMVVDGDLLFCTLGAENESVIAFNRHSGEVVWKCSGKGEKSAYCSPLLFTHNGRKILVTMTEKSILGIDAKDGELLWSHDQPNKWSVHANTPLYKDGMLYCTSGYGQGGVMLTISEDGNSITEKWRNQTLDPKMGGVVPFNNRIYGSGDKNKFWSCIDWETGTELYRSDTVKIGNLIMADGLLYWYSEAGKICLVEPTDNKFNIISVFDVPFGESQHWAHLVIHNKRLFVRHGESLMVYNLAAEQ